MAQSPFSIHAKTGFVPAYIRFFSSTVLLSWYLDESVVQLLNEFHVRVCHIGKETADRRGPQQQSEQSSTRPFFSPSLPAKCVFIIQQGGVQGFFSQNGNHVLVEGFPHLTAGNGTGIHYIVGNPDKVNAPLPGLILKQAVQAAHSCRIHGRT